MLWTNSRIHTNSKSCFYWNRQQLPYIIYQTVSVCFASFSPKFLHYWQIIFLLIRLADKQICYKDQTQPTFIDICTQCSVGTKMWKHNPLPNRNANEQGYYTFESFLIKDNCVVLWSLSQTKELASVTGEEAQNQKK